MATPAEEIEVEDKVVRVTNPDRVYFPERGWTKLDLVEYYLAVGDGIVNALYERPCMLHRFPKGLAGDKVHQKRVPAGAPPWLETVRLHFPRFDRDADELCVTELAAVIWAVQMSTVEFHPWNSRRADTEKPDEWRIDLDPGPECDFATVQRVAHVAHEVLDELGAVGWPKTSGGSGMHIYVRIPPDHGFKEVRRACPRVRAGGGAPLTGRHHGVVAQGPRPVRAVRRLQPERPRPHDRRRLLGARLPGRPGVDADHLGRDRRRRPARLHPRDGARRASPSWATCTPASTTPCSTSRRCWSGPTATTFRSRDPTAGSSLDGHADAVVTQIRALRSRDAGARRSPRRGAAAAVPIPGDPLPPGRPGVRRQPGDAAPGDGAAAAPAPVPGRRPRQQHPQRRLHDRHLPGPGPARRASHRHVDAAGRRVREPDLRPSRPAGDGLRRGDQADAEAVRPRDAQADRVVRACPTGRSASTCSPTSPAVATSTSTTSIAPSSPPAPPHPGGGPELRRHRVRPRARLRPDRGRWRGDDKIVSVLPAWSGELVFVTEQGVVGAVDQRSGAHPGAPRSARR